MGSPLARAPRDVRPVLIRRPVPDISSGSGQITDSAIATLEVQKGFAFICDCLYDVAHEDDVIASVVGCGESAIDVGQRAVKNWRSRFSHLTGDAGEFITTKFPSGGGEV